LSALWWTSGLQTPSSQVFAITLVIGITSYPAMDLPVYGEASGANFTSIED